MDKKKARGDLSWILHISPPHRTPIQYRWLLPGRVSVHIIITSMPPPCTSEEIAERVPVTAHDTHAELVSYSRVSRMQISSAITARNRRRDQGGDRKRYIISERRRFNLDSRGYGREKHDVVLSHILHEQRVYKWQRARKYTERFTAFFQFSRGVGCLFRE